MPVGVIGCISFVTLVYTTMALVLVMMVPSPLIDETAAFAVAFEQAGFLWGRYLVAVGAVLGTTTGAMVGMMGVARLVCCLCRSHIGPPVFGRVNAKRGTPIWATVLTTVFMAPFVILTDLPALIDMCSAAALAAFAVVAIAHLFKRWNPRKPSAAAEAAAVLVARGASRSAPSTPAGVNAGAMPDTALGTGLAKKTDSEAAAAAPGDEAIDADAADVFGRPDAVAAADGSGQGLRARIVIALIVLFAIGFGVAWGLTESATGYAWVSIPILAASAYAVAAYGFFTLKKLDTCVFEAPCFPFLPTTSLLFNAFLMASINGRAYWQLAVFWAVMVVLYLIYSVHAATVFDAIQGRGCDAATRLAPKAVKSSEGGLAGTSRTGSVIAHRESELLRGRANAGVSILPPQIEFVALAEDEEEAHKATPAAAR
jgi:hypothetical protein